MLCMHRGQYGRASMHSMGNFCTCRLADENMALEAHLADRDADLRRARLQLEGAFLHAFMRTRT